MNIPVADDAACLLVKSASKLLAAELGKPEEYVMVSLRQATTILFAESPEPAAFLEVKSIGLSSGGNNALATALADLLVNQCRIERNRIYTVFTSIPASHWAQGGECFGQGTTD